MEQQLNGPDRDEALAAIRQVARPADELAAVVRSARLRAAARHGAQPAAERPRARCSTELPLEDQVVVFRVLPRKDAAATFEYLSHDAQEALLKAMAQEDVAALLNDMAPDDRTMFLEELPATATRAAARAAHARRSAPSRSTLLGYPEGSIGRLMTPRLRRRPRGLDRPAGARLRPRARAGQRNAQRHLRRRRAGRADRRHPHPRVPADRRRPTRVARPDGSPVRRAEGDRRSGDGGRGVPPATIARRCRSPTPPACSIGIVTDRRRARRGGSGGDRRTSSGSADRRRSTSRTWRSRFGRMIQKRAGWLTALFLGEMLTATAMGVFEEEIAEGGGAGAVRAADHLERRQLRLAGLDAGHPRAGARRGRAARLVAGDAARGRRRAGARRHPRHHRLPADRDLVGVLDDLRRALAAGRAHGRRLRWSASCCGAR